MKINGIFFDAGGIFYERKESPAQYAARLVKEHGFTKEVPPDEEARLRTMKEQASNGWISAEAYWDEYLRVREVVDPVKRAELSSFILRAVNNVIGIAGARETVQALKNRGFILGVISSTMYPIEWKMAWLTTAGVAEFIDVVACSTKLGWDKHHPTIFWAALNQANMNPWQAAYVANGAAELTEAHRLGMATVAALYEPNAKADYYVQTLPELLDVPIFQP